MRTGRRKMNAFGGRVGDIALCRWVQLQRMDRTDQKARMADGNDFAFPRFDAVEDSVITVGDFAYIGIAEFRDFSTAQREIRQMFNGIFHVKKPIIGGLRIVVLRNTSSIFRESSLPARRPDDFHGQDCQRLLCAECLCLRRVQ